MSEAVTGWYPGRKLLKVTSRAVVAPGAVSSTKLLESFHVTSDPPFMTFDPTLLATSES